jgi:hypothetical protein
MRAAVPSAPTMPGMARTNEITPGRIVGWVLVASLMFWPRLFLLGFFIFYDAIYRAFDSHVLPWIGFFVLPWTTVTYAAMWGLSSNRVYGWEWICVVLAFLLDLWTWSRLRRR